MTPKFQKPSLLKESNVSYSSSAQPAETEGVERQRMIESMCLTWRHDFGLDAPAPGSLASGMTESGRQHLRGEMGKLFDHHFAPVLSAVTAERDDLRLQVEAARSVCTESQGAILGLIAERDQLRAEVERLQAMTSVTCGVGDGSGKLFVHGDYDSIKRVQALVFDVEALRELLRKSLDYFTESGLPEDLAAEYRAALAAKEA